MNNSVRQISRVLTNLLHRKVTEKEVKDALVELDYLYKDGNRYRLTPEGRTNCEIGEFYRGIKLIHFNDWYESVIAEVRQVIENKEE